MFYYYKSEHGLLKAKHELSEEELGKWEAITEEEYKTLKSQLPYKISRKSDIPQE